jgi:hypothetical protein
VNPSPAGSRSRETTGSLVQQRLLPERRSAELLLRGKYLALLQAEGFEAGRLVFHGRLERLSEPRAFARLLQDAREKKWVVYANGGRRRPGDGGDGLGAAVRGQSRAERGALLPAARLRAPAAAEGDRQSTALLPGRRDGRGWPQLAPVLTQSIDWTLIRQQFDQMVKYTTALRDGEQPAGRPPGEHAGAAPAAPSAC